MQAHTFVEYVKQRANLPSQQQAWAAIRATLQTLAERLPSCGASHAAAQLPADIAIYFRDLTPHAVDKMTLPEFFSRIAEREHVPPHIAERHAEAVIGVLAEALSPGELLDVCAQLPIAYRKLLAAALPLSLERLAGRQEHHLNPLALS